MVACLKRIAEEINKRTNFKNDLPYKDEFIKLLRTLDPQEKILFRKYFRNLEWNIGSSNVLDILQDCKIISATEYILSQEDEEHVQCVLNDFLESKFKLLANILTNCCYDLHNSAQLTAILEDCFKQLFSDLITKPTSMTTNYVSAMKRIGLDEEVITMLDHLHINVLLQDDNLRLKSAFTNLQAYSKTVESKTFLYALLSEITKNAQTTLEYIFKTSTNSEFKGWKNYILLLEVISTNSDNSIAATIKNHLKELFKRLVREKDIKLLYIILLTARIVYTGINPNLETYQQWFKTTIGEMNYLITPQEFKYIVGSLGETLAAEEDLAFLEIQTNTSISAPPLCNQIVLNYKKKCRRRIAELKNQDLEPSFDMEETIIIDED